MDEIFENKLKQLPKVLGYQFKKQALLVKALTHRSVGEENNERFEFLGDSILNFVMGNEVFTQFEEANEGTLTRLRAQLVCGETLADIAKGMNLGDYLLLGAGEKRTGGHQRQSILADALEAVIGAIFLDSDIDTVKKVILSWFQEKIATVQIESKEKDAKTRLQELLQAKGLNLPTYEIVKTEGEQHAQVFYVACDVELLESAVEGVGQSRRKAEQNAAEAVLRLIENGK